MQTLIGARENTPPAGFPIPVMLLRNGEHEFSFTILSISLLSRIGFMSTGIQGAGHFGISPEAVSGLAIPGPGMYLPLMPIKPNRAGAGIHIRKWGNFARMCRA